MGRKEVVAAIMEQQFPGEPVHGVRIPPTAPALVRVECPGGFETTVMVYRVIKNPDIFSVGVMAKGEETLMTVMVLRDTLGDKTLFDRQAAEGVLERHCILLCEDGAKCVRLPKAAGTEHTVV
ncbi:hypothetical protein A2Z33_01770 [Candidatus Gottesmanbacteria bacterium RBG_16_52_11]|uniref:Uncharacterized protein n=1 Tax=Candidatus Gottesmanbacteria bacterium RBG_16_52_11 TaxID=1798374 RepID=A0A1F5YQV4_9BACT|nr:MAG: hypothetical protein A2Z33_01770 [Candidatus Gottesmanbacteria bacterium RBG_16_52_11]